MTILTRTKTPFSPIGAIPPKERKGIKLTDDQLAVLMKIQAKKDMARPEHKRTQAHNGRKPNSGIKGQVLAVFENGACGTYHEISKELPSLSDKSVRNAIYGLHSNGSVRCVSCNNGTKAWVLA